MQSLETIKNFTTFSIPNIAHVICRSNCDLSCSFNGLWYHFISALTLMGGEYWAVMAVRFVWCLKHLNQCQEKASFMELAETVVALVVFCVLFLDYPLENIWKSCEWLELEFKREARIYESNTPASPQRQKTLSRLWYWMVWLQKIIYIYTFGVYFTIWPLQTNIFK